MDYLLHLTVLALIYCVLAKSLDLLAGVTGLISLAHAAFFGLGGYTAALLSLKWQSPVICNLAISGFLGAAVAGVIALAIAKTREDHFVIATLALQTIAFGVFNNWTSLTGGSLGLAGVPSPGVSSSAPQQRYALAGVVLLFSIAAVVSVQRVAGSAFGRVLRAIREDETVAESFGKNVFGFKLKAFAASAGLASAAGCLYAHFLTYIDPSSFTVMESIFVVSMVILGGLDTLWGPLLGALLAVGLPEILRFVGFADAVAANLRQVLYGFLLVAMMMLRPRGILGRYDLGGLGDSRLPKRPEG